MKYGIVKNKKFVLIDDDLQRLKNTLPFMPQYRAEQIAEYADDEVEQGHDGNWYKKGHAPQKPLEEAKAEKLAEINAACDRILSDAASTYPETEILTFDQQTAEAKAYLASGHAEDVPLLFAMAQERGLPLDELAKRVIAKHQAFSLLSGTVIGQRQALEDRLNACTTREAIRSLAVEIAVPC